MKLGHRIFLHLFSAVALVLPLLAAPMWTLPDGIKSIEVNGYNMAYEEKGSGVPLVLVHGAMSDYRIWSVQVPEFAKKIPRYRRELAAPLSREMEWRGR